MLIIGDTSGTTGPAKRVMQSEQALLAMAETDVTDLGITPGSVIAIDRWHIPGIQKIYWARVSGARVALYPGAEKRSIRNWILDEKVTHISTLWMTIRHLCKGIYKFPNVEVVEGGGEMGHWDDVRLVRERFPNATVCSRFATMETRVICRKRIEPADPLGEGRLPVGKPVKGVAICISETGEIAVNSPYMFEGYYNDPELTAAKFRDGWYYTGDKGYWLANGELMHCGRADLSVASSQLSVVSESTHDERVAKWTLAGG